MTLIKRADKGEALTYQEMDGNLTHLGGDGSYVAPATDGNPGQILATDGNGQLFFTYAGTGDTLAIRDDDGNETGINLGGDALSILGGNGIKTNVPQDSSQSVVISLDEDFLIEGTFRANQINAPIVGNDSTLLVDVINSNVPWSVVSGTPTTTAGYGITDAFDGQYASLTGTPTNVSAFTNDAGYVTALGTNLLDVKGSVFGDDSTVLVDGVSSKINLAGTVKGNIIPDQDEQYDLGSATKKFKDLYLSTATIYLGTHRLTVENNSLHLDDNDIGATIDYSSIQNRIINLSDLANVGSTVPTIGQVLKWDGSQWSPGEDISNSLEGLDATTLDGFSGNYYLNYNNFTNIPTRLSSFTNDEGYLTKTHWNIVGDDSTGISINNSETLKVVGSNNITTSVSELNNNTILNISGPTALSSFTNDTNFITGANLNVIQNTASGNGSLSYNSSTRIFTYTPPDLSSISQDFVKIYETSWSNGPSSVTISNTYVNSTYTKYILYVDTQHGSQGGTVYLDINKTGGGHTMTLFSNTGNESSDWHFAEVHISYDVYIRAWSQALTNTEGGGGYTATSSIGGSLSAGGTPSSITLRSPNSGLNSGYLKLYGVK